jgi:hypothetical protein
VGEWPAASEHVVWGHLPQHAGHVVEERHVVREIRDESERRAAYAEVRQAIQDGRLQIPEAEARMWRAGPRELTAEVRINALPVPEPIPEEHRIRMDEPDAPRQATSYEEFTTWLERNDPRFSRAPIQGREARIEIIDDPVEVTSLDSGAVREFVSVGSHLVINREALADAVIPEGTAEHLRAAILRTLNPEDEVPIGEQLELLPERRPLAVFESVPLTQIPTTTEQPAPDFTANVERLGVILPVALIRREEPEHGLYYTIADGRRRLAALRRLDRTEVPAMVFPAGTPPGYAAAVTLSTNLQRRINPVSELEAIEALMRGGRTEEEVAEALRLSVTTLRARLRMSALADYLREEVRVGTLSVTGAMFAARLPRGQQRQLHQALRRGERWPASRIRSHYFPGEDPAQETIPLATGALNGVAVTVTGWDQILTTLELLLNAVPRAEGNSMEAQEIHQIAERMNELIDMVTPFAGGVTA